MSYQDTKRKAGLLPVEHAIQKRDSAYTAHLHMRRYTRVSHMHIMRTGIDALVQTRGHSPDKTSHATELSSRQ